MLFSQKAIEIVANNKIQEALEQGKFKNLPGRGKPLPDHPEQAQAERWVKRWMQREDLQQIHKQAAREASTLPD